MCLDQHFIEVHRVLKSLPGTDIIECECQPIRIQVAVYSSRS